LNDHFATSWRNLAIVLWNKEKKPQEAIAAMENAFSLDPKDAESCSNWINCIKKRIIRSIIVWKILKGTILTREADDLYTEYITLLNLSGQYEKALENISGHIFHPWEGGEGKLQLNIKLLIWKWQKKLWQKKNRKKRNTIYWKL
jgi:tetratricopeptide (TPR) repeat protein